MSTFCLAAHVDGMGRDNHPYVCDLETLLSLGRRTLSIVEERLNDVRRLLRNFFEGGAADDSFHGLHVIRYCRVLKYIVARLPCIHIHIRGIPVAESPMHTSIYNPPTPQI